MHLAIRLSRTVTIADLVENLKTASSEWLKTQSTDLAGFSWQRGYGCFSVGPTDLNSLCTYIVILGLGDEILPPTFWRRLAKN